MRAAKDVKKIISGLTISSSSATIDKVSYEPETGSWFSYELRYRRAYSIEGPLTLD